MFHQLKLFPVILIIVGILILLKNFGYIESSVWQFIGRLWPLLLIFIGIKLLIGSSMWCKTGGTHFGASSWCKTSETESLALDLGTLTRAEVQIKFGAGNLSIQEAATGKIVDGTFIGGVRYESSKDGTVRLSNPQTNDWFWWGDSPRFDWRVGLTREVPLNLRVDVGAAKSDLDLSGLKLESLVLHTGASSSTVRLPSSAGKTAVSISAGAASVNLVIPEGVAARIRTVMAIGSTNINQHRFPFNGGVYVSPDYETATNKIDIEFKGGVGSLNIL